MTNYADTSFLCAHYRDQQNSPEADAYWISLDEPLPFTSLLEFEFFQAVRFQVFLHAMDRTKGYPRREADQIIADWESDVAAGLVKQAPYDAEAVNRLAKGFSARHTTDGGHRAFDVLHVATAVHLGAKNFLTFDARQRKLAKTAGLRIPV